MTGLVLISHGPFAEAALETVKMLQGEPDNVRTIRFEIGESAEQLKADIEKAVESMDVDAILAVVDILGGSPFNVSSLMIKEHKFNVITGLNIPALVEILPLLGDTDLDELSEIAVMAGQNGVIDVSKRLKSKNNRKRRDERNAQDSKA